MIATFLSVQVSLAAAFGTTVPDNPAPLVHSVSSLSTQDAPSTGQSTLRAKPKIAEPVLSTPKKRAKHRVKPKSTSRLVANPNPPPPDPTPSVREKTVVAKPKPPTRTEVEARLENCQVVELKGVHFETAKANLKRDARNTIRSIATAMQKKPSYRLVISGHTDSRGSHIYNEALARARAQSVVTELAKAGIARSRLTVRAYGETQPKLTNATEAGRAGNRRVEVKRVCG